MIKMVLTCLLLCFLLYLLRKFKKDVYNRLKYYFKFFLYYFLFLLSSIFLVLVFLIRQKNVHNGYIYGTVMKHLLSIFRIDWRIRNSQVLGEKSGAVIISNHQSALDILGMFHIWKYVGKMCFIMKKEFLYMGTFGLGSYLVGSVFVDRKNTKNAYESLEATKDVLTTQKTKIVVYPEGTRNLEQKTKLLSFKKGAFQIAVMAQVPIIPVVFSPYYFIDRKKHIFDSGYIIIECLEPVPTAGLTKEDVPELTERLHGIMLAAYERLCDEVMRDLLKQDN